MVGDVRWWAMTGPEDQASLEDLVEQLLAHARTFDHGTEWQLTLRPEIYALLSGTVPA